MPQHAAACRSEPKFCRGLLVPGCKRNFIATGHADYSLPLELALTVFVLVLHAALLISLFLAVVTDVHKVVKAKQASAAKRKTRAATLDFIGGMSRGVATRSARMLMRRWADRQAGRQPASQVRRAGQADRQAIKQAGRLVLRSQAAASVLEQQGCSPPASAAEQGALLRGRILPRRACPTKIRSRCMCGVCVSGEDERPPSKMEVESPTWNLEDLNKAIHGSVFMREAERVKTSFLHWSAHSMSPDISRTATHHIDELGDLPTPENVTVAGSACPSPDHLSPDGSPAHSFRGVRPRRGSGAYLNGVAAKLSHLDLSLNSLDGDASPRQVMLVMVGMRGAWAWAWAWASSGKLPEQTATMLGCICSDFLCLVSLFQCFAFPLLR